MNPSRLMRGISIFLTMAGTVFGGGEEYLNLPSAKKMPKHWAYYRQVEHKGGVEDSTSSVCVSGQDLLKAFPVKDGSGLYWDYVSKFQVARSIEQLDLGSIEGEKITETVLRFKEPVDYIKILSFTPPNSDLFCPFTTIADFNSQLQYSKSEIIENHEGKFIKTSMVDNIAFKSPQPTPFYFQLKNGFPTKVKLKE